MMSKLILTGFFVCSSMLAVAQSGTIKLSGKLVNFSNQVEVEDLSEFQNLLPPAAERVVVPDSLGNFSVQFNIAAPNYFRMGRNILYLTPGDDMKVVLDKSNYLSSTFDGRGSEVNRFLCNTPFPKGGSYLKAGSGIKTIPAETLDGILAAANERKQELAALKNASTEFRRLEEARIKADVINSINSVNTYAKSKLRYSADSLKVYLDEFRKLANPVKERYVKDFVDASFLKLVVYRDVTNDLLSLSPNAKDRQSLLDWKAAYMLIREMQSKNDRNDIVALSPRIEKITTSAYRDALRQSHTRLMKFGKGSPAADFTAMDTNGKKISLSSLKGKVIYVDIWATWCGPCMAEMPAYEKLKEKFKGREDVAFISLSVDTDLPAWQKSIESRKADGFQWQINRNALDAYNIVGIPRSLLIDKDFRIVEMNASLPSEEKLPAQINQLAAMPKS